MADRNRPAPKGCLTFRLSDRERELLALMADADDRTHGDMLRVLIREAAKRRKVALPAAEAAA